MDKCMTAHQPQPEGGWIAIALSDDVPAGCVTGVVLAGRHLALWRDEAGQPHLWEDRCPHRGMRMSLGFVRGNALACLYHGWRFDGEGVCRHIPAHPELKVPARICMKSFDVAEGGGMLWGWSGPHHTTGAPAVPATGTAVRSIHVTVPAVTLQAALEDPARNMFSDLGRIAPMGSQPGLYGMKLHEGKGELVFALQPASSTHCALHAVLHGDAPAALRAECARRMGWLRDGTERVHDMPQGACA